MIPTAATGLPADPNFRYNANPHALLGGPSINTVNPALFTTNPMLQHMINKAIGEVRAADKVTRQLLKIDITAKQLAMQMAEYEEMVNQQDPSGGQGPGGQIMGDDSGA